MSRNDLHDAEDEAQQIKADELRRETQFIREALAAAPPNQDWINGYVAAKKGEDKRIAELEAALSDKRKVGEESIERLQRVVADVRLRLHSQGLADHLSDAVNAVIRESISDKRMVAEDAWDRAIAMARENFNTLIDEKDFWEDQLEHEKQTYLNSLNAKT